MASRRKLEVEDVAEQEVSGSSMKLEDVLIIITLITLICGIVCIMLKLGSDYDAGLFKGF